MLNHKTTLTLQDVQTAIVGSPLVVDPTATVAEAIALMSGIRTECSTQLETTAIENDIHLEARSSCVIVVEQDQVRGILTERDVVRLSAQQHPLDRQAIADVMTHPVITIQAEDVSNLFTKATLLQQHHIRHLPVLDGQQRLIGLITHESLRYLSRPIDLLRLRIVSEVMGREVVCADSRSSMLAIAQLMAEHRVSSVVIVEPLAVEGDRLLERPIGILTERDLVQFQALGLSFTQHIAEEVMSTPILTVAAEDSLLTVQQLMEQFPIRRLAVVGAQGELLGIVTQSTVLQALNPIELYNLAEVLERRVVALEEEKVQLLERRAADLEEQVMERTIALQSKAERERLVAESALRIRMSLNLDDILSTAVAEVRDFLSCDRVLVYQFLPDGSGIIIAESVDHGWRSAKGNTIRDSCFQQRQASRLYGNDRPVVINDIYDSGYAPCHIQLLEDYQVKANVVAPIRVKEDLWGLLIGQQCRETRNWRADDVNLMQDIAVQLAIAIQQATTHQQLQSELNERQQAEDRLRNSEERYASLAAAVPVGIFRADLDGQSTYVNRRYCQITGLSEAEALGANWQTALHPDDRQRVAQAWDDHLRHDIPLQAEYRYVHASGQVVWVYGQALSERDPHGNRVGYVGTITDISDRKQAENALIRSEQKYREAQRIGKIGHWELDLVTNALYWSDEIFRIFEIDPVQLSASYEGFLDLVHPDDRQRVNEAYTQSVRDRLPYKITHRLLLPNGQIKYVQEQCETLYDTDGTPLLSRGTVQDITAVTQAQLALKRLNVELEERVAQRTAELAASEHLFRRVFDSNVVGMMFTDFNGQITQANDRFLNLLGYTREDLQSGQINWMALTPPEYVESDQAAIAHLKNHYDIQPWEKDYFHKDGHRVPVLIGVAMLSPQDESCVGVIVDISDRKHSEMALRTSQQFLQTVLDAFPLRVFWKDQNLIYQGCNQLLAQDFGCQPSDIIGKTDFDLPIPYEEALQYRAADQRVMTSQQAELNAEICTTLPDGSHRWIETNKLPLFDLNNDEIIGVLGIFQDITSRKENELARRESDEKFRQLAEVVDSVLWILNLDRAGRVYVSPAYERIWGRPCEELYVTPEAWAECIHPDDRPQVIAALPKQMRGEFDEEYRIIRPDGSLRWIRDRAFPVYNDQGEIYRLAGIAEDITSQKQTEQLIQQQANRETLLREITQRIRQSLDLQTIFETTCQEARQFLQVDRVAIFKFDLSSNYDDGAFVAEAVGTGFQSVMAIKVHDHCFGEQYAARYAQGQFQAVENVQTAVLEPCHKDVLVQFNIRANLVLPILNGTQLWGLICAHQCSGPRPWQPFEISVTQEITNQLAIALYQASLYEQVQTELVIRRQAEAAIAQQLQRQKNLGEIVQQIRESLDIAQILSTVTHQVQAILNSDRVIVFRLFPDGRSQIVEEAVSPGFPALKSMHWEDEMWSQEILELYWQGLPRIIPDVMGDRWTDCLQDYSIEGKIQSKMVAPILQETKTPEQHRWVSPCETNKLWGVLVVHACSDRRVWQESEAQLLQQIANQLAIALQQASLYEQLQTELTTRQKTEAQLEASRAYYQSIIADQTELICRYLPDGTLTFVNEAYCKFFQKTPDELLGQVFTPLLPEEDQDIPLHHMASLSIDNPVVTYEHRVFAPDGTLCWQQWTDRAVFAPDGTFLEFQAVGRDISSMKNAEAALRQSNEELARATRLKDEFLANMSHELRTPLNAILGMTEGLQEEVFGTINDEQQKALTTVERSGSHLLELINDILDVAKIESGQIRLELQPVSISHLCQSSLAFIKQQALQKRIQIDIKQSALLPELMIDERRIRQVLINLLNNAVKFTPEGGNISVEVSQRKEFLPLGAIAAQSIPQDYVRISVIDTGIGISAENLKKLFQPFVQIDSALNRQYSGTGLGLALVKQIVELHRGRVGATSEPGVGSCFSIDLPCAESAERLPTTTDFPVVGNSQFKGAQPVSSAQSLVLLAEDNEANISTLSSYLRAKGYQIVLAKSGQEAIDQAIAHHPDVILMDIQMPKMDGLEAIERIRQQDALKSVPIIALTALAMEGDRDRCIAAGANDYLSKPIKLKQLAAMIQDLLSSQNNAL